MSEINQRHFNNFIENPPQSLILIGSHGCGKKTLLLSLALEIVNNISTNIVDIVPLEDKKQISIDQIRNLKSLMKLTHRGSRVVLIPNAEKLTQEAQSSLLKLLEEPPSRTYFLLACPSSNSLLQTIRSRSVIWRFVRPSSQEIKAYYNKEPSHIIDKAIIVTNGLPGLLSKVVFSKTDSKLLDSLDYAKELLSESPFERLCKVNILSKDPDWFKQVLNALLIICQATIYNVGQQNDIKKILPWQKRLQYVETSLENLDKNIQIKLVIGKLFLVL